VSVHVLCCVQMSKRSHTLCSCTPPQLGNDGYIKVNVNVSCYVHMCKRSHALLSVHAPTAAIKGSVQINASEKLMQTNTSNNVPVCFFCHVCMCQFLFMSGVYVSTLPGFLVCTCHHRIMVHICTCHHSCHRIMVHVVSC
jgi:hypothetical protein